MSQKDKHKGKSGFLFFLLTGAVVSVIVPALFAAAGFLYMIPYLNIAGAVLLSPVFCLLLYKLLLKKTHMGILPVRVLTGLISALGGYVFICVLTGVLSGLFGALPVEIAEMREMEIMEIILSLKTAYLNAAGYFAAPGLLWQDAAARGEMMWGVISAATLFIHIGLPQLFIVKIPNNR